MKPKTIMLVEKKLSALKIVQKALLICGVLSSLLYVGTDILAAMQWEGYSYISQAVSELMAIGAPTRSFVVSLFTIYNLLLTAFGLGILLTDSRKRLRFMGILLMVSGIVGQVALLFFPMHLRGVAGTISDTMHIIFTGVMVLFILFSVGLGAAAEGKCFCLYSIGTILILLLFGTLAGFDGSRLAANQPTPWIGVWERINIYSYMLWVIVLAIILLRREKSSGLIND